MILGNVREELRKHRAEHPGQHIHHAGPLAYLHDAQPQGQHACKSQRRFEGRFGRVESRKDNLLKDCRIAHSQLNNRKDKGYDEECYPNIIEYHNINSCKVTKK